MDNGEKNVALMVAVREVLRKEWDPIGVGDAVGASSEYDGYASRVGVMLRDKMTAKEIRDYLVWAVEGRMGLSLDQRQTDRVVEKLMSLEPGNK